jgi:Replication initiator protein, pSAM2
VLSRAKDPDHWERFERQMRATAFCRQPVRLRGQVDAVDRATGECRTVYSTEQEPDRTLLKSCGNRRGSGLPFLCRDLPW